MREKAILTNWSEATRNPFKLIADLVSCLQSGNYAVPALIKNELAAYPINIKNPALDEKENWTFSYGVPGKYEAYLKKEYLNETEKDLTLNYKYNFNVYECENGHSFVKAKQCKCPVCGSKNVKQACCACPVAFPENRTWFDMWKPKDGVAYRKPKEFKRRDFVVVYAKEKKALSWWQRGLLIAIMPLKLIPTYHKLKMDYYTNYTFRIGGVSNGFAIEIQIPKKFSF